LVPVYLAEKELDNAVRQLERLLAEDPGRRQAANNLALVYLEQGKAKKARQLLEWALDREPGNTTLHYNLDLVYQRLERLEQARGQFEAVLAREPEDSRRAQAAREAMAALGTGSAGRLPGCQVKCRPPAAARCHMTSIGQVLR
jgi:tetratricopeptide (TPR) repeat protein